MRLSMVMKVIAYVKNVIFTVIAHGYGLRKVGFKLFIFKLKACFVPAECPRERLLCGRRWMDIDVPTECPRERLLCG